MYSDLGPMSFKHQPRIRADVFGDDRVEYVQVTTQTMKDNVQPFPQPQNGIGKQ